MKWEKIKAIKIIHDSPGAKIGTRKSLRVQGFMIDPDSMRMLKEFKRGCHDGNLGKPFFYLFNS